MKLLFKKLLMTLIFFTGLTQGSFATEDISSIAAIQQRGTLQVGILKSGYPPFVYYIDKQPAGADIDLAKQIAESLGVKIKFVNHYQFPDQIIEAVQHGNIDIGISGLSITLNRATRVSFTKPYTRVQLALLIPRKVQLKHTHLVNDYNQDNITIGVVKGSSYIGFANQFLPNAKQQVFSTLKQAINALDKENIDAVLLGQTRAAVWMQTHPAYGLTISNQAFDSHSDDLGIVTNYKNYQLLYWLNLFLSSESHAYDLQKSLTNYLKQPAV